MNIILILIISISLSMDAFSLSLAYGTIGLRKKTIFLLTVIVSLYHFVMPLIGLIMGHAIITFLPVNPDFLVFLVLTFIGVQMLIESFKKEDINNHMSLWELLAFGFAVSLDSFSVGIGLSSITDQYLLSCLIFSICSGGFTYFGLFLGKYIHHLIGKLSTILGGIVLILLGIIYILP
ncbi:MAG TPA: manganese efflux pump [Candidatus Pelethosoma merdigallinarum]|nr:manganese efflux pump [Candidatus Pelethosoma merdigallinarum]